jgi:hypothetical protein
MDLRRLRLGESILAISGLALIVSLFLPWDDTLDGWRALSAFDVALALLAAVAIAAVAITARASAAGPGVAAEALVTPFALVLLVVFLFKVSSFDGAGAWIGIASTFGVFAGALVAMRDERLSTADRLTDATGLPVDKAVEVETLPAPPPA